MASWRESDEGNATSELDKEWLKTVSAAEVPSPKTNLNLEAALYDSPAGDTIKDSPTVSEVSIISDSEAVPKVPEEFELKTKEVATFHSARDLEKKNVFIFSSTWNTQTKNIVVCQKDDMGGESKVVFKETYKDKATKIVFA